MEERVCAGSTIGHILSFGILLIIKSDTFSKEAVTFLQCGGSLALYFYARMRSGPY